MDYVEKVVSYLAALTLASFTAIILIEVVFRYYLHIPLGWPNELSILLFQWTVFLGTPVALRRGLHFTIDVAVSPLPKAIQIVLAKFAILVCLGVGVALTILSYEMVVSTWHTTYTSLPMPVAVSFMAAMVAGILIVLFSVPMLLNGRSNSSAAP